MKGSTTSIAEMMMGDRRFGDNAFGRTQVVLEQTMCPEILAGFQNLRPAQLEPFQGLLLWLHGSGRKPVLYRPPWRASDCRRIPAACRTCRRRRAAR